MALSDMVEQSSDYCGHIHYIVVFLVWNEYETFYIYVSIVRFHIPDHITFSNSQWCDNCIKITMKKPLKMHAIVSSTLGIVYDIIMYFHGYIIPFLSVITTWNCHLKSTEYHVVPGHESQMTFPWKVHEESHILHRTYIAYWYYNEYFHDQL